MRNRIDGLVIALNRSWEEAAPSIAALQAELKEPTAAGLDEGLMKKYEAFRLAVVDLSVALKDVDLAMGQLDAEREGSRRIDEDSKRVKGEKEPK